MDTLTQKLTVLIAVLEKVNRAHCRTGVISGSVTVD
ncbi:hypothetical protein A1S9_03881 [Escherichia coli KTE50]|nr:hypothetical protein A1S9_03881 [Escherichia coli KTE50]